MISFLTMGFSSAYGYGCWSPCSLNTGPLGTGFTVGGYGSFHTVFFNVRDKETTIPDAGENSFRYLERYDTIQEAPGGGGFLSYGCKRCNCLIAAVRLDAIGLAQNAKRSYSDALLQDNIVHEVGLRWILDLSFQPGFLIGKCILGYLKAGGTVSGVREQVQIKRSTSPHPVLDKKTKYHHPGGYVLGAGANFLLMNCFSFFMEYDWHAYLTPFNSITTFNPFGFTIDTHVIKLHCNSFSFGIATQF
ncbi:MAG: hypothetical protein WAM28_01010 [Chlamydiales bacterium]